MKKPKLKPIEKQTVVITGASSGIGLATAQFAASCGAQVVLSSRNAESLIEAANWINERGGQAIAVAADVRKYEDVENLKNEALKKFGKIDTWVNNAGLSVYGPLLEIPLEEEREIFEINFWGVRHGCRVAVPVLAQNGGALINVGSEVSSVAVPLQGMYSASKHAVKAYTDALRLEINKAELPISVTLVRPAAIDTPFTKHALNRLRKGAPSLPPPVYDVGIVARAIVKCAEVPHRDAYIGGVSRFYDIMETLAPRLTDRFMSSKIFEQQSRGDLSTRTAEDEALMGPPPQEGRIHGDHQGHVAKTSVYTNLTTGAKKSRAARPNPMITEDDIRTH